ncbi:MAG TPA: GIY-YIG nuclease family protein [Bacillota bacterium]|jgi:hypothetical protein|nr:GIY-YIG nuclease family protein [Fastidiosipila sp.]HPX92774.1 GIY-YIG nuclease family protein [Bacillota bacterium]HQB81651.1 GIY-YIG nuclease family protein [Bacillota bacterium]
MCELSNWNGRVYKIARSELSKFAERGDADNTGIYFLLGKDDFNVDTIYIGESEHILTRLKQHLNDSRYWNDAIAIISKDDVLNKAHIKYLENQFFEFAKNSERAIIQNQTTPTRSSISEYDEAMLAEFISNTRLLVNVLGHKVFDSVEETVIKQDEQRIQYLLTGPRGANAQGYVVVDGFVVIEGSVVAYETVPSFPDSYHSLRDLLIKRNILDSNYRFIRDYIFTSPSTAASIVLGRAANGRTAWCTEKGKKLKDMEEQNMSKLN